MDVMLSDLVERLDTPSFRATKIIPWSCPVPVFGNLASSVVATLGLNPSKREFVDGRGKELDGPQRRLPTLKSLKLPRWSAATAQHIGVINESCRNYFSGNPYNGWFRSLEHILSGARLSYYGPTPTACHLDLIPYATSCKWTELTSPQRTRLLLIAGDALGLLLRESPIQLILLNGRTVVDNLGAVTDAVFKQMEIREWTLPRQSGKGVPGIAFRGTVTRLGGVDIGRSITVLGYNHNIQSSFGVTKRVKVAIRRWIAGVANEVVSWDQQTEQTGSESMKPLPSFIQPSMRFPESNSRPIAMHT